MGDCFLKALFLSVVIFSASQVKGETLHPFAGEGLRLDCGLTESQLSEGNTIFWRQNDATDPFVVLTLAQDKVEIRDEQFKDRINLNPLNGTLIFSEVKQSDSAKYTCSVILSGRPVESLTYELDVYVKPVTSLKCSKDPAVSAPSEMCSSIEADEIASGACKATSKPKSIVGWVPPLPDCMNGNGNAGSPECTEGSDGVSTCISVLRDVCPGTYTCVVHYLETIVPLEDNEFTKDEPEASSGMLIPVICGIAAFVIVILLVVAIMVWWWKRRRQNNEDTTESGQKDEEKPLQNGDKSEENTDKNKNDETALVQSNKRKQPVRQMTARAEKFFDVVGSKEFDGRAQYKSQEPHGGEVTVEFDLTPRRPLVTQPAIEEEPSSPIVEEMD